MSPVQSQRSSSRVAALAAVARWLGGFDALDRFQVDQESLAIWLDSLTFLASALIITRLSLPESERKISKVNWTQTFRDIMDGLPNNIDGAPKLTKKYP